MDGKHAVALYSGGKYYYANYLGSKYYRARNKGELGESKAFVDGNRDTLNRDLLWFNFGFYYFLSRRQFLKFSRYENQVPME